MSESPKNCPVCGHSLLGITSTDDIASCPSCGMFFDSYRPRGVSRWPAVWVIGMWLCGLMAVSELLFAGGWFAKRAGQVDLAAFLRETHYYTAPFLWFVWPVIAGFILAKRYAALPDRWMAGLGLSVGGMVGNTAIMLMSMLLRVLLK